jgi:hypothetical protein
LAIKIDKIGYFIAIKKMATTNSTNPDEVYYIPPKPIPLPEDYGLFYKSLSEDEKELIELAKEKLGTSFIIMWSHMYKKWKTESKK